MNEKIVGMSAQQMSEATKDEWIRFVMLLGGDSAVRLADALGDLKAVVDRQRDIISGAAAL